jgi:RimJ/RimL family protein N-acetyltransferase
MIETDRLLLRQPRLEDAECFTRLWSDPVVTRHIGGEPLSRRQSWTNLLAMAGHWRFYDYGGFIVQDKTDGAFLGQIGFQRFAREIDPSREDLPEAGWVLAPEAHGRGYATEGVRAILAWSDRRLEAPSTVAIIDVENHASIRVAERSGYRSVGRTLYRDTPIIVFERPRGG